MLDPLSGNNDLNKIDSENLDNNSIEKEVLTNKSNEAKEAVTTLNDTKDDNLSDFEKLMNSNDENKIGNIILNINVNSINDLIKILTEKGYEYLIMEGNEDGTATISFRSNEVEKEKMFIKYPIYSKILLKIKSSTKLEIDETEKKQEGKGEIIIDGKNYDLISKTTPSKLGEKVFFSAIISDNIGEVKKKQKMSIGKMLGFLGVTALIAIILGGGFVIFILLNAGTDISNVRFFLSLGIKLSEINIFVLNIVTTVFSLIVFIETIITIIYFFKFFLTKKEEKRKRVVSSIIWITFALFIFITLAIWMFIYKKILALPNWEFISNGIVVMYDNDKFIKFKDNEIAFIKDTKNIIGPISIKYDLTYLAQREERSGFRITKYIWTFGDNNDISVKTQEPITIHKFDKSGTFSIGLEVEGYDSIAGKSSRKKIDEIPPITVTTIDLNEKRLNSGGKIVEFDASNLKDLGNIEWFSGDDLKKPIISGPRFNPQKPIFKDTFYIMRITNEGNGSVYEKVFIINGEIKSDIDGEIFFEQDPNNELNVTLGVKNIKNSDGNGYIKYFKRYISNEVIDKNAQVENQEKSSEIVYNFKSYGDKEVKVLLTSSNGKTKELTKNITIKKSLLIKEPLKIYNENLPIEFNYKNKTHEYFVDNFGIPTVLKLDASDVTSDDIIYLLMNNVKWDTNNDGKIDKIGKAIDFPVDTEGNKNVVVYYTFEHRKIKGKTLEVQENIYINGVKKEAQLDLKVYQSSTYAPVTIKFDASKSQVKNEDIVKFIYNYGDGTPDDERDAINSGHKYIKNGEYTVNLTVVTESGKKYSIKKKIILKPEQEQAKITSSLKKAPVDQGIDFLSNESKGQIIGYFWDFGDGENSTEANPTHSYKSTGTYRVVLRLDFINNNSISDEMNIEIE